MLDLDWALGLTIHLPGWNFVHAPLAYVGMGPGPEFIPYFMALLGVVGAALAAIVQWPILALLSWFKGKRSRQQDEQRPITIGSPAHRDVGGEPTR